MSFVIVIVILGMLFMVSAISKAVHRYYAKSQDEEEENVADTVKFLLGTPASSEDRQAVNEFNEFIRIATKMAASRLF